MKRKSIDLGIENNERHLNNDTDILTWQEKIWNTSFTSHLELSFRDRNVTTQKSVLSSKVVKSVRGTCEEVYHNRTITTTEE